MLNQGVYVGWPTYTIVFACHTCLVDLQFIAHFVCRLLCDVPCRPYQNQAWDALCREWLRQVDSISVGRRVGLLWMDLSELQVTLKRAVQKALATLCMVLEVASHTRLSSTLSALQAVVLKLRARPSTLPQFAAFVEAYKHMDSSREELLSEGGAVKVCDRSSLMVGATKLWVCCLHVS
jgi:hypothetical protein